MNIQEINQLTSASLDRLTSDQYKDAFNDEVTGKAFAARVDAIQSEPRTATRPRGSVRGEEASAPASTQGFDPSFDESPNLPAAAAPAPAAAAPAAPAAAAEPAQPVKPGTLAVWEYQPTDREGRPLGGKQVFRYDPTLPPEHEKSLASQLTKSNIHVRRMANERKVEAIIDSVKAIATAYKEPTLLTEDQHPNAAALNEITRSAVANGTLSALNIFKQNHSADFVFTESNATAMVKWIEKSGRNPSDAQTWEVAWAALKPYLAPEVVAPAAAEPAPTPAPAPVAVAPAPAVRPTQAAGVATGFSNADSTSDDLFVEPTKVLGVKLAIDNKIQAMTLAAWDRLPSDTQKRILRNSANAAAIESLYTAENQRQTAARR